MGNYESTMALEDDFELDVGCAVINAALAARELYPGIRIEISYLLPPADKSGPIGTPISPIIDIFERNGTSYIPKGTLKVSVQGNYDSPTLYNCASGIAGLVGTLRSHRS